MARSKMVKKPWSMACCQASDGGAIAFRGGEPGRAEQGLDGQGGGAEGNGVRSQAAEFDRCLRERIPQRMLAGRLADGGQHPLAEHQSGPSAEDDPLRVEQVDEVADA